MVSIDIDNKIIKILLTIARNESQIEVIRQNLANEPYFEPYAAFQRLDRHFRGYVSSGDLKAFLTYLVL